MSNLHLELDLIAARMDAACGKGWTGARGNCTRSKAKRDPGDKALRNELESAMKAMDDVEAGSAADKRLGAKIGKLEKALEQSKTTRASGASSGVSAAKKRSLRRELNQHMKAMDDVEPGSAEEKAIVKKMAKVESAMARLKMEPV